MEERWIAGFWRRIGALIVDGLVLGFAGFVLGLALEETFIQLGGWGRLIGFAIALLYFGIMNSSVTGGQTIGKKLLNVRVVNASNHTINLARSFARYTILGLPFFLNGVPFINEATMPYLIYPVSLIVFGGLISIPYLYIFNRVTRQSLHDLVVGTYVVNSGSSKQDVGIFWKPHLIVVAIVFALSATIPAFTAKLADNGRFRDLQATQQAISNKSAVNFADLTDGSSTFNPVGKEAKTRSFVNVQAFLLENKIKDSRLARNLAEIVVVTYADPKSRDVINITLTYGYDIGIWSRWSYQTHSFDPAKLTGGREV